MGEGKYINNGLSTNVLALIWMERQGKERKKERKLKNISNYSYTLTIVGGSVDIACNVYTPM